MNGLSALGSDHETAAMGVHCRQAKQVNPTLTFSEVDCMQSTTIGQTDRMSVGM